MSFIGRNEPCPCGSGKRYKDCHGGLSANGASPPLDSDALAVADKLQDAMRRLKTRDVSAAYALAHEILAAQAEHPEALRILGHCHIERGNPDDALRCLLRAARSLSNFALPPATQYAVWIDLNSMFTQALSGLDRTLAVRKRYEYEQWRKGLAAEKPAETPLVSVVLIVPQSARWLEAALDSVYRQTYRNIELVLVHGLRTSAAAARINALLQRCPFAHCSLMYTDSSPAAMANAGVRAASGAFINVLDADDAFVTERIATLVQHVVNGGAAWGFTGVGFVDGTDGRVTAADNGRVARWLELQQSIAEADTVGTALIQEEFVVVATGNLFFSRDLFDDIGGFRELPHVYSWDFALRALWQAEPVMVSESRFQHRLEASPGVPVATQAEFHLAQVAMFAEFYKRACDETEVPPNRYAPCVSCWGLRFLKKPFQVGHVLAFSLDQLDLLADAVIQRHGVLVTSPLTPGVNLVGLAFGELGVGENLRALAKACAASDTSFVVKDVDLGLNTRQTDLRMLPYLSDELRHSCSLYCLNPDMLKPLRRLMDAGSRAGSYAIGYWYWELAKFPREWLYALDAIDEIWTASEFVQEAIRGATRKPVVKIPPPIDVRLSREYDRSDFELPDDRFLFLFSFDFNSFPKRKNPEGVIAAFKSAFGRGRRDVGLVIKSTNGANLPDRLRDLHLLADDDDRIAVKDGFLSRDQVYGLEKVVDAYVSLHRSEGLGLGLAESMFLGKPVIGTGYSGNLEFMNDLNSCLIGYELVPVGEGDYRYDDKLFRWAEPDVGQAAHYMRQLVDDRGYRMRLALQGQHDIRTRFTYANTAALMRRRLGELGLL